MFNPKKNVNLVLMQHPEDADVAFSLSYEATSK